MSLRAHTTPTAVGQRAVAPRRTAGPAHPAAAAIRALQRSAGNRATATAVRRTLARCGCGCGGGGGCGAKGAPRPEDELLERIPSRS